MGAEGINPRVAIGSMILKHICNMSDRETVMQIHNAVKKQLGYLNRNIKSINRLLDQCEKFPLNRKDHKYLFVITTLYEQQQQMFTEASHSVEHRIVSIHQPHVRPIVRGKTNAYVEFGAKIQTS
jgi:hypothetical protein